MEGRRKGIKGRDGEKVRGDRRGVGGGRGGVMTGRRIIEMDR